MLGRKNYTKEEINQGKTAIKQQLAAYYKLAEAASHPKADSALEAFETLFFNNLILALDRYFVHRLPGADYEGKDGNPLNEVRLVCDSIMNNDSKMRDDKQIKLTEDSILKLKVGDPIKLTEKQFKDLSTAYFSELEKRFL